MTFDDDAATSYNMTSLDRWQRLWLLIGVLYLPVVVSSGLKEWPSSEEQIRSEWENELRMNENRRFRFRSEVINERYEQQLRTLGPRQANTVLGGVASWALPMAALYAVGTWIANTAIQNWHPGQLIVLWVGAALVEYFLYESPIARTNNRLLFIPIGILVFGIPIVMLAVTWKWFGERER